MSQKMIRYRAIVALLIFLFSMIFESMGVSPAAAAVNLLYFRAVPDNQNVKLEWATATELNNVGFFVQRSTTRDSGYNRINSVIIPAKGDGFIGSTYDHIDTGVTSGIQYWYRLESIDVSQGSQLSDPVSITLGSYSTPTLTQTSTATQPVQQTITPATPTITPTATSTTPNISLPPTFQIPGIGTTATLSGNPQYPGPGQQPGAPTESSGGIGGGTANPLENTPIATPSPVADAGDIGPSGTLQPFPTVTIIFPVVSAAAAPIPTLVEPVSWIFSRSGFVRLWPLGLLLVAWLAIGAWFYLSHRQLH